MGSGLAESIDEVGTGKSVFLTENLWGVGSTPPYMHDGRATTLTEAILAHGGEGTSEKNAFAASAGFLLPNVFTKYFVLSIAFSSSPIPLR